MSKQKQSESSDASYLSTLKYDPSLEKTWWARYVINTRFVILLIIAILGIGMVSYTTLPRRLNPEVKIPSVLVSTILPGASPTDIESLVTKPLEKELSGLEGLDSMSSSSRENSSSISLQFSSTTDVEKARQDTQSAVDAVVGLPEDTTSPKVLTFDFENEPVWQFVLYGKNVSLPALFTYADRLKNAIEESSRVKEVTVTGAEVQEIQVIMKPERVHELGLTINDLRQAVITSTASYPAGTISTAGSLFSVAVDPQVTTVADLRNIRITTGETVVRLADVATVAERSASSQASSYFADTNTQPTRVVSFSVFKTKSSDIDEAEHAVAEILKNELALAPEFSVKTTLNAADQITEQFGELTTNFRDTILLVFIVLVAFLGFRQAFIASLTIPLTFLSAFAFMRAFGLSINFLSLFSLLLALGLLIDDTVVTVQAMTAYSKSGRFNAAQTGIMVWRDFIVPIWSTTLTTIWAFVPLLLATGIIGEFIKSIPIVVTVTLISSTAIAVLITLPLMIFSLNPQVPYRVKLLVQILLAVALFGLVFAVSNGPLFPAVLLVCAVLYAVLRTVGSTLTQNIQQRIKSRPNWSAAMSRINRGMVGGFINMEPFIDGYRRAISYVISSKVWRRNTLIIVTLFAIFSYLLLPAGFIVNEFFPKSDADSLYINLELPAGTTLAKTSSETISLVNRLRTNPDVSYVSADVGQSFSGDGGSGTGGGNTTHLSKITLNLNEENSTKLAEELRQTFATYTVGKLSVVELSGGPPAGADVQIKLLGDDLTQLDAYAKQVEQYLSKQQGVRNIERSIKPGTSKLVFEPDYTKLKDLGIDAAAVGGQLRTATAGLKLDALTVGDEELDIVFRYDNDLLSPAALSAIMISARGVEYPLLSLGTLRLETNPTLITRQDQKRTISVSASVAAGYSNVEIGQSLEKFADTTLGLAPGYSWETGGANEENAKSIQSIMQAMLLAFMLIFINMVLQFGSYRQAVLALLVIPFAVSGVFLIFAVTGTPLSFPALIGVLALFGIVVTHAIMLLDKINLNLNSGMPFEEAIVDAGASRLEPILLTSLLTIVGLVPITLSDPFWRGLGGAIIAGLLFTGAIKLFFIPVVFAMWFRNDYPQK